MTAGQVLRTPPADVRETTRVGAFLRWLGDRRGLEFAGYHDLWQWSVDDLPGFWSAVWEYFDLGPYGSALGRAEMPGAEWFPGTTVNYAEAVLRMPGVADDDLIVHAYSQTREPVRLTAADLRDQVARARAGLLRLGVGRGDRVAAYAPNIPETFVLLLATASLGAVFSSCAPEFGTRSVTDRWIQIAPKVLVAVDGYRYGDKDVDRTAEVAAVRAALPSVQHVVSVPYLGGGVPDATPWADLLAQPADLAFEPVPFAHPLYVLYSSGTTGLPKPIVHGHGGILLEHMKMLALHQDLGPGDRFFWFTTTGWMMWNYLVSAPAVGSAIVLFDGNPAAPDLGWLWRLAGEAGVTYFGTSAPFLLACRKAGVSPKAEADLSALRGVGSTGAPLPPEGFRWVYAEVSPSVLLASLSGGTDMCTGFVGGSPLLPVYEGEIACRCLGARVEAFDSAGKPVIGSLGELVITAPMPSMPVGFWGDESGERYRDAYFSVYPGVWRHGDWIRITPRGSAVIQGRSDSTLNRLGVRIGTSEVYSAIESLAEIKDSLVIGLELPKGGYYMPLFVVLADGVELDDALKQKINATIRAHFSPRHVPDEIVAVPAIPRTLSDKKMEVPVKKLFMGVPIDKAANVGATRSPEAVQFFAALARARSPLLQQS